MPHVALLVVTCTANDKALYGVNHVVYALVDWADPWCPLNLQGYRQNITFGRPMASEVGLEVMGGRSKARSVLAHSHLDCQGTTRKMSQFQTLMYY